MKYYNFFPNSSIKKLLVCIGLWLFSNGQGITNDAVISNLAILTQNTTLDYTHVQFDIAWSNSWRVAAAPANWDACWMFIKWRKQGTTVWNHGTINYVDGTAANDGHTQPANSTITTTSDGKGMFIYRSANFAQAAVSYTGVKLRWNYGTDGLVDSDLVEVAVLAIEMVYVPQGSFYLGSGGAESGAFYTHPTTTNAYQVASENAINVGATAGYLNYPSGGNLGDGAGPIPAAFPKGYDAFYCMKTEASQEQYVHFLNKLTYAQQDTRTANAAGPAGISGATALISGARNGVEINTPGVNPGTPAVYGCNLDNDGIFDEALDGAAIACNQLSWEDQIAYLDWAALRPMSELEYEKACRGTAAVVANEYAWGGTTNANASATITNSGAVNETPSAGSRSASTGGVAGPLRGGSFAQAATTRLAAGASFYGIMEMSGNLWERPVTVGQGSIGRIFTGLIGDGALDASGNANVTNWPAGATGIGFRGGNYSFGATAMRVSDRSYAANVQAGRYISFGIRGVREP